MARKRFDEWPVPRDGENWSREETLKALALYFVLPSGQHSASNQQIRTLARELGRTPASVVRKLGNLGAHDPNRPEGRKGLEHSSKRDVQVWDELASGAPILYEIAVAASTLPPGVLGLEPEESVEILAHESGLIIATTETHQARSPFPRAGHAEHANTSIWEQEDIIDATRVGKDRLGVMGARIGQTYFRQTQLANYEGRCALTDIAEPQLLVASHVRPWSKLPEGPDRVAADNGILLNALLDKAFDQGLITIDKNLRVIVSSKVPHDESNDRYLWSLQGEKLRMPRYAQPRPEFIEYHNDEVFLG